MRRKLWLCVFCAAFALTSHLAVAEKHGHGKHHKNGYAYSDHDRNVIRSWYHGQDNHLPPGLAKKDRLPPGLERQLVTRGTLPPGLRKKIHPCPPELARQLPPPPAGYAHTVISGHIAVVNRRTYAVLDVVYVEP